MIEINKHAVELKEVWGALQWKNKFTPSCPKAGGKIKYVWYSYDREEVIQAKKVLSQLPEKETSNGVKIVRSAHLGCYVTGEAIVICESKE